MSRIRSFLRKIRCSRGVAAVEFALILPVLLLLYIGGVEVSQAISLNRKLTLLSRTVSDLVAQASSVTEADIEMIFDAAQSVISPFPPDGARIVVSSIGTDSDSVTTVRWSRARNTTARAADSSYTLPAGIAQDNSSVIMAEVTYDYEPIIGYVLTGTLTLGETVYMRPRTVDFIPAP